MIRQTPNIIVFGIVKLGNAQNCVDGFYREAYDVIVNVIHFLYRFISRSDARRAHLSKVGLKHFGFPAIGLKHLDSQVTSRTVSSTRYRISL